MRQADSLEVGFAIVKRQQKRVGLMIQADLDVLQEPLPDIQQFGFQRDFLDCHSIEFLIEDMCDVGPVGLQQLVGGRPELAT